MDIFGKGFMGQVPVMLLGQRFGPPPRPTPPDLTVYTPPKPSPKPPSERMTPEQKAGIPDEIIGEIDYLCELAGIMERYMTSGGTSTTYAEFEKAQELIGDDLEGYAPNEEEFIKKWVEPWCPEGADLLRGVVNEKIRKYEEGLEKERAPMPTPGLTPRPGTPSPTPTSGTFPRTVPLTPKYPSIPTQSTVPMRPSPPTYMDVPTPGTPQYGTDLQRQIDSYMTSLQEFSSRRPSYPDIYNPPPVATPSALKPAAPTPSVTSAAETSSFGGECPPGEFPEYPGGPCRPGVATGGLPGIPGAANVAPGMIAPTGGIAYGTMGLVRFPVVNIG